MIKNLSHQIVLNDYVIKEIFSFNLFIYFNYITNLRIYLVLIDIYI